MARRWRIGYGCPVLAAAGATVSWFSPGHFFAAGDVPPYLRANLSGELGSLWNHQITGAGSTSYAIVQALDVALLAAARSVGASPVAAQQALYALVAGFAAFGAAYLAGAWVRHPVGRAAAGLLGAFNAFLMVSYPNVLPALAIGLVGVLMGMVLRASAGRPVSPTWFALATLPASYLAQNPPLLVVSGIAVVGAALLGRPLAGPGGTSLALGLLLRAGPRAVLVNLWWLAPYAMVLLGGDGGAVFSAETNVSAWAWTQVRSSVANVLTLNAHWGWDHPEYYPYAGEMERGVWPVLRWGAPTLALAGVLLADCRRRPAAWIAASAIATLTFAAKGVHPPLGSVNLWLFEHVPGLWLLRDPMSKLGVPLVLAYACLVALAVERSILLCAGPAASGPPRAATALRGVPGWRRPAGAVLLGVAVAALAYPWPLWTGEVAPSHRQTLTGSRVAVPASWQRLADRVNAETGAGKVLVLPLDSYYQVGTDWGYYGIDSVPAQLIRRTVLQQLPGRYFSARPEIRALLSGLQESLVTGDSGAVGGRLRALGVSHLVVRHDLRATPYGTTPADVDAIEETLGKVPDLVALGGNSAGNLYRHTGRTGPLLVQEELASVDADDLSAATGLLPADTAVTTGGHRRDGEVSWQAVAASGTREFQVARAGRYQISRTGPGAAVYRVAVEPGPGGARLALTDAEPLLVDGRPVAGRAPLSVPLTRADPVAVLVDGSPQALPARIVIGSGTRVLAYGVEFDSPNLLGALARTGRCGGPTPEGVERALCLAAPVRPAARGGEVYRLSLSYRTGATGVAGVCLFQEGPGACADLPALDRSEDWSRYAAVVRADPSATGQRLYLRGDSDPAGVAYRDVRIQRLELLGEATLTAPAAPPIALELAAGRHHLELRGGDTEPEPARTLYPCPPPANAAVARGGAGAVEVSSRAGTVCVKTADRQLVPAGYYELSFDYRNLSGQRARFCLWQEGPDRCAELPALDSARGWRHFSGTVRIRPGVTAGAVYAYADSQDGLLTTVAYRQIRLTRAAPSSVAVRAVGVERADGPELRLLGATADRYTARVRAARGLFVLTLTESYARGWRLSGLPRGWSATHIRTMGYANGWIVEGTGDATITLEYRPQLWVLAARAASVCGAGTVLATATFRPLRPGPVRRGPRGSRDPRGSRGGATG